MRLKDVARRFDRTQCLDGYSGAAAFKAQILPYDEVRRDAVTFERRVFSVDPSVTIPARRVVTAMGEKWILGVFSKDQFLGSDIRSSYVGQRADSLATLTSIGKLVNGQAGTDAWAGRSWVKNPAFSEQSSDLSTQYDVYMSNTESTPEGVLINYLGEWLVTRVSHLTEAGFNRVTAETLGTSPLGVGAVTFGAWNPVTDSFVGTTSSIPVLKIRWQSLFEYSQASAPAFEAGDQQLAFSSLLVDKPLGATVILADGTKWKVQSAMQLPDNAWICRSTRHG